jgi:hypothetical protein
MSKPKVTPGQLSFGIAVPQKFIEHVEAGKRRSTNAQVIPATAENGEPVVINTGKWAVCTTKGRVLVAHLSFEAAKAQARKLAMEQQMCVRLVEAK